MADRISCMLDNMITAVDEGLSYDGIVSVPEAGLEDAKLRTSLAGSFRDGMDRVRTTNAAISQGMGRAVGVFKRKQHDSSQPAPDGDISGKNHSEQSLALSDEGSEYHTDEKLSVSSVGHSERDKRNHFARVEQPGRDETETLPGCFLARPSMNRTRSAPISGEGTGPSHLEKEPVEEEWQDVSPDDISKGELLGKNDQEPRSWRTRFGKRGSKGRRARSAQLSDVNQERLPANKQDEECVQNEDQKESVPVDLSTMHQERLPRKKGLGGFDSGVGGGSDGLSVDPS